PGIILHGTATLALAVSQVMRHADLDPRGVRRVRAGFTGMVPLPSHLTVRAWKAPEGTACLFDVRGDDAPVVSRGALYFDPRYRSPPCRARAIQARFRSLSVQP